MAEFKSVEFLGIGVAAIFVSIFWGGSVSVRALLAVAASVAALDLLRPLWRVPVRSKSMEKDDLSAESPPCSKDAVVASMSAIAASLRAALRSIARRAAGLHHPEGPGCSSVQVLSVVLAAFLISCGAKVLHIPGYPWNCLVLGVFLSRCSRRFAAERQQSEQSSEIHVDSCPYSPDFWKELGTIEMDEEEEEFPDDLGDTRKLMAKMGEKGASMKDDGDQEEEEVSTEADKEDEDHMLYMAVHILATRYPICQPKGIEPNDQTGLSNLTAKWATGLRTICPLIYFCPIDLIGPLALAISIPLIACAVRLADCSPPIVSN